MPSCLSHHCARAVVAVCCAAAAVSLAGSATGATRPPTGDQKAIRFFGEQANAYGALPGVKIVETGFYYLRKSHGTAVSYSWGNGPQPGYRAATATILAQTSGGQIVAYLAAIRAPKIRRLRILMSGGAVFTSTTRCWRRSKPSGSPLGTGYSYVFNDGGAHFLPLARDEAATSATMTYPWAPGAVATEVSRFAHGHPGAVTVTVTVRGTKSMAFRKTITPLHKVPSLPVQPPPSIPRPKPMCK